MAQNPDQFAAATQWNPGYGPGATPAATAPAAPAAPASPPGYAPNPDQFMQNVIPNRAVDVKLSPTTTTNTNTLNAPPVTNNDIQSLITQNQTFQQQVLGAMQPTQQENQAVTDKNQAYNTLQNFDVSLEGGIQGIMNKPIALEFQQGQEAALTRDAAFTRSSLARSYDASVNNLTAIQNQRNQVLQAAQQQVQFGQSNIATKLQLDQIQRTEQAAALKTAIDNGVTTPFFTVGGTVYSTGSGQPFTSEADFKTKTGMDVGTAQTKGLIQTVDGATQQGKAIVHDLLVKYPDAGITLNDPLPVAQAKIFGSNIYRESTRLVGGGTGGGGSGGGSTGSGGSGGSKGTQPNVPAPLAPYTHTSYSGQLYVDLSSVTGKTKDQYAQLAAQHGIAIVTAVADVAKINAIADAKTNLVKIQDSVNAIKLGNQGGANVFQGLLNSVKGTLGNADIKSYNAWRTAIINNVQALAGGAGSGLRINKAEIDAALQNDLPVITGAKADTPASAAGKLAKLNTQLDTWEKQLVGGGNTSKSSQTLTQPDGTVWKTNPDGSYTRIK